jgi:hypothetical protein
MAHLKLIVNFKFKAIFSLRVHTSCNEHSPPWSFHVNIDLNIVSSSTYAHFISPNIVSSKNVVPIVVNLEQEFKPQKSITKKWKYKLGKKFQDVWATWLPFVVNRNRLVTFVRCKVYSTIEGRENLLMPKMDYLLKHTRRWKAISNMPRVKIGSFIKTKNVITKQLKLCLPKSHMIIFCKLLSIKIQGWTKRQFYNLLSFCTC